MNRVYCYILGLFPVFFAYSCNEKDLKPVYHADLVFPASVEIKIPDYEYTDSTSGRTFRVIGDKTTDTLGSTPVFQWEDRSSGIFSAAISTEAIRVENGSMVNPESIIWIWHNTMPAESGYLNGLKTITTGYDNGKKVFENKIFYSTQPLPLESGLYYWMVWGWDKSGTEVVLSTVQKTFFVE